MRYDPELGEYVTDPGTINVEIPAGINPTCPGSRICVGQGWRKSYCGIFRQELSRAKKAGGKLRRHSSGEFMYQKCPECLYRTYHNSGVGTQAL